MPTCFDCAHDNPPAARFCAHCGAKLAQQCPKCAAPVNADQHFCGECGTALIDSQPTPPHLARRILDNRQALRGERKQVTVLFCDVVESTVLAMRLGAEGMHALLSEFFSLALAEVHRFEGTVNQFLGDGFMAIFGAPLAYEDHAARAGLAVIAIRDAIARARQDVAGPGWEQVHVRLGLNSGQVVVGTIGRRSAHGLLSGRRYHACRRAAAERCGAGLNPLQSSDRRRGAWRTGSHATCADLAQRGAGAGHTT